MVLGDLGEMLATESYDVDDRVVEPRSRDVLIEPAGAVLRSTSALDRKGLFIS